MFHRRLTAIAGYPTRNDPHSTLTELPSSEIVGAEWTCKMKQTKNNQKNYSFSEIEAKWQQIWEETGVFRASDDHTLPKYYLLIEFPYPSGDGLHVGHPRSYSALDVVARVRRMQGYNVLYPIGWDAFGLPTENFAIKTSQHPRVVTERNIENFRGQLKRLGLSFDWSREVNTTDPAYYKWTQWIFLKLFEKGLAYKAEMPINWCVSCKVGLANEEVVDGVCERCGAEVTRQVRKQWMLRITEYAERLLSDLDTVDFLDKIKTQQRNWIGQSSGAEVDFKVAGQEDIVIRIFTTRPDTLFGATYMVLSPEHPLARQLLPHASNPDEIEAYCSEAINKSDFERAEVVKEVTGVQINGIYAINPVNQEKIPIWIADYVLLSYGTGAIMAVPGHDERDFRFARKYGLPIIEVISGGDIEKEAYTSIEKGTLVNSGFLNGLSPREAIASMNLHLEKMGLGKSSTQYKLRDWVFSRQRYWGEPIPMIQCPDCGWVPIPENELPLVLPEVERYQTTDTGESPLSMITDWIETQCPRCHKAARRETDTMPQWAGSSWYFLRYVDPHNDGKIAAKNVLDYWTPVDWYNGGMEHTTLHLLYSRFWHKFLYDIGVVPSAEPYRRRTSHGLVLGENNEKMSKSRGNVVNPDQMVQDYGADSMRLYEMFMGAFDQPIPWSTQGLIGMHRFLRRVWDLSDKVSDSGVKNSDTERLIHKTIKQVSERIEVLKFNTAIASLMTLANHFGAQSTIHVADFESFVLLLSPFAPHISEELWEKLDHKKSLAYHPWPVFDEAKIAEQMLEIPVQVNGKVRSRISVMSGTSEDEIREQALAAIAQQIGKKQVVKVIVVGGESPRLASVVVK